MTSLDPSSPFNEDSDFSPNIATELRCLRMQQGLTLDEVATQLCISKIYLQAIEEADLPSLPERVYIFGFIRAYARLLGIDDARCVQRFRAEILKEETQESFTFPMPLPSDVKPSSQVVTFSTLLLVILFIVGYGSFKWRDRPSLDVPMGIHIAQNTPSDLAPSHTDVDWEEDPDSESPAKDAADPARSESDLTLTAVQETDQDSAPQRGEKKEERKEDKTRSGSHEPTGELASLSTLTLSFTQPCWIQLKDAQQKVVFEKTFQAGERFTPPQTSELWLKAGNAGGVHVHFTNGEVKKLGDFGEVTTHVSLDEATLSDYLRARNKTP